MYDKSKIECLYGAVGWRQTENPDFPVLSPSLITSRSGRYFNDEHPLMNIEYIDQSFKNYASFSYASWAIGVTYISGVRVEYSGTVYESLISGNIGNQPDISPAQWLPINELSQKLEWVTKSSIDDMLTKMYVEKKLNKVTKSIFENVQIFDGAGSIQDKTIKRGRFVGITIELLDHQNLAIILESIGLQLDTINPTMKIYVFHSSREIPIIDFEINYQNESRFEWFTASKLQLKYYDPARDAGGFYIIGYYEDDLLGQAINKSYSFDSAPLCGTCNRNHSLYTKWSRYVRYQPIAVSSEDIAGIKPSDLAGVPRLFDINKMSPFYAANWGLNLDITVKCDTSDLLCKQEDILVDAIRKEVTLRVLKELSMTTRNVTIAKEVADRALYELNQKENPSGFLSDYKRTMKAVEFDFSDLNDACLPCNERWGVSSIKS